MSVKLNDFALGCVLTVFGGAVVVHANGFPEMAGMAFGPDFFPMLIGAGFVICGISLVGSHLWAAQRTPWLTLPDWMRQPVGLMRAAGVLGAVVFYVVTVPILGFLLTVFLATFGLLLMLGNRMALSGIVAAILPVMLHFGFSVALRVPLPRGPLEQWLF